MTNTISNLFKFIGYDYKHSKVNMLSFKAQLSYQGGKNVGGAFRRAAQNAAADKPKIFLKRTTE